MRRELVVLAGIAVLAAGCGSGTSGSAPVAGAPTTSQTLAYVHCMRAHGVATFPDPNGSGEIPKTQVVSVRKGDPSRFDSADHACRHLLPSGGNGETAAEIAQDWSQDRSFARCMRSHGVPNWPDPISRSTSDRRPTFDLTAAGIDGISAQLRAKAQHCASGLHLGGLPTAH